MLILMLSVLPAVYPMEIGCTALTNINMEIQAETQFHTIYIYVVRVNIV